MSHGLINEVVVTPANVTDSQALSEVCPDAGVILKNNMKDKNRDKDRWLSAVRMPFESVFARLNQRARYRGRAKNQFQALMPAFAHNLKRLIKIETGPIPVIEVQGERSAQKRP